jgi:hypothetical protein
MGLSGPVVCAVRLKCRQITDGHDGDLPVFGEDPHHVIHYASGDAGGGLPESTTGVAPS